MVRRVRPSKYAPLTAYLAALPADEVRLALAEIETIIGAPLPVSARGSAFWTNRPTRLFMAQPWVQAGWRVVRTEVYGMAPAVTFARVVSDSTA